MHYRTFFPTLLQHVPPTGYQIIRYYGLYANSCKIDENYTIKAKITSQACTAYKNPKKCACCETDKVLFSIVFNKDTKNQTDKIQLKNCTLDKFKVPQKILT
jgi:hypothetical protein